MAFQQNLGAPTTNFGCDGNVSDKQKRKSVTKSVTVAENLNGCFDCNICLDSCHDPVVTLCGHLYCWPCIYKWLRVQSSSDEQPKCPVCKTYISTSSLVPLYGRGASESEAKKPHLDLAIPDRPPALGINAMLAAATNQQSQQNQTFHQDQYFSHPISSYTSTSFYSLTINMVSEMVFARIFGSSETSLFANPHSNSYPFLGNVRLRLRRQEMQLDKSLNRVSIFFFCCIVLCLVLF